VEGSGTGTKTVVVSEVEIIYGTLATSTSIVTESDVSTITPSPSNFFASTFTNSFGEVESEEVGILGTSTVTVSLSIISTVTSGAVGIFGTSRMSSLPVGGPGPTKDVVCADFTPVQMTATTTGGITNCATDISKVDYSQKWPTNSGFFWMNVTDDMVNSFCDHLMNIQGPDPQDVRKNISGTCMTWAGSSIRGVLPVAMHGHNVTFELQLPPSGNPQTWACQAGTANDKFTQQGTVSMHAIGGKECFNVIKNHILAPCEFSLNS
jgi:hypothetical protein